MKKYLFIFLLVVTKATIGQESRFSVEVNYGLAGNHFVTSYIENSDDGYIPEFVDFLANKRFLGSVGQLQVNYHLKNNTSFSLGYARDSHQKEVSYKKNVAGAKLNIHKWAIRHNNNIYFFKHKRNLTKVFDYHFGLFYLRPEQQEIEIDNAARIIEIEERDNPGFNLNEAGILAGLDYEKQIDTKFKAGFHLTGHYILSASYYETTYFTGSISYILK